MLVTYKHSTLTGYTGITISGSTKGGGNYVSPQGAGYQADPCGKQCSFFPGENPPDNRATLAANYSHSQGYCSYSYLENCNREGYCAASTGTNAKAGHESPYAIPKTTSLSLKITCLDGFTSTQGSSEAPYTKTAELACVTSSNSGKEFGVFGNMDISTSDCYYKAPINPISLYAQGYPPTTADSEKTATYCMAYNSAGACEAGWETFCTGCVTANQTIYDGCGKAIQKYDVVIPAVTTRDPCPVYFEPPCENAIILSKAGMAILSGQNVGHFSSVSAYNLSTDKAVEFDIQTGSSAPKITETFSYSNPEVTLSRLEEFVKDSPVSHVGLNSIGVLTGSYNEQLVGLAPCTGVCSPNTMFASEKVAATKAGQFTKQTGPGSDPCCIGSTCTWSQEIVSTTDTVYAGKQYTYTHYETSTTMLGDYYAIQPITTTRIYAISWYQFAYSTSWGGAWQSNKNDNQSFSCLSYYEITTGGETGYNCWKCVGGNVPVDGTKQGQVKNAECPDLGCGCTGAKTNTTAHGDPEAAKIQCYDPCSAMEPCKEGPFEWTVGQTAYKCCATFYPAVDVTAQVLENNVVQKTDCKLVDSATFNYQYTHYTSAQTDYTLFSGRLSYTFNTSEGIIFVDSSGSLKTATSFDLKQSKSEITHSHVSFAFSWASTNKYYNPRFFYNPMGRTTQFGLDGEKKTFIALATGDATHLVGSPEGGYKKSASTTSHNGDVHSYYISDPDAKNWNQASWPGHGVVNGKITTGTFSFSFSEGHFDNSYGGWDTIYRYVPGAKHTIVANGGLNIISSKAETSESSFKTTYSTEAFSTSFDSTFAGAWIVRAVEHSFVSSRSVKYNPIAVVPLYTPNIITPYALEQLCSCKNVHEYQFWSFPNLGITNTSEYFIKGKKSLLYLDNADSYLWTHPASKKVWGTGHGSYCT